MKKSFMASLVFEELLKNDTTIEEGAASIAKDLTSNAYGIVKLCENLKVPLTSESLIQRVQGTLLLSRVLAKLPKDCLHEAQLNVLTEFYSARLKDHHNVVPAVIEGLDALAHMTHMTGKNVVKMLQSFFLNTTCQSQLRSDRYNLFNFFQYISGRYVSDLKEMSGDFIYGIISSIEGERDPRNLDLIFSYMPEFIATYPLLHLSEEMFEIFACYFPIDFNPTLNDPSSITRDILSAKLTQCLVASPNFIQWTIDLALEKLSSDLTMAKCDSLDLLYHATLKFPNTLLEPYFEKIWLALKAEICSSIDNKVIWNAALRTLKSILVQAAKADDAELSHKYQTLIFGTIITHLNDLKQSLFEPCVRIALICVHGDPAFAGDILLKTFLIKLNETSMIALSEVEEEEKMDQYTRIYNIIAEIFSIICSVNLTIDNESEAHSDPKMNSKKSLDISTESAIKDQIHSFVLNHLENMAIQHQPNNDVICSGVRMLKEATCIINEHNRMLCYKILLDFIKHDTLDVSQHTTELVKRLGEQQPVEVSSQFANICIENFPSLTHFSKEKILKNLVTLIGQPEFTSNILNLIYKQAFNTTICKKERLLSLTALNQLLRNSNQLFINKLQSESDLINKYVHLAVVHNDNGHDNIEILSEIELGLTLIVQSLNIMEQNMIMQQYLAQLNFQESSCHIYIAKGLLGFLHSDVKFDEHLENLLNGLLQFCLHAEGVTHQTRQVAHKLLCSLVNKCNYKEAHNCVILRRIIDKLRKAMKDENKSAIEAMSWLAKGLITCGSDEVEAIIEELANVLEHPTLGHTASLAFDIISNEYPQLHLPIVKYLYQQKFFHLVLRKFSHYLETRCEHHLSAFIYVLKMTPYAILKMNIEKIGPILLNSLQLSNVHTLKVSLRICRHFIQNQDEYFSHHITNLIADCLKLSQFKDSMEVRIAALDVLLDLTKYPTYVLLPQKVDVVLELAAPLDDNKRLVRNAAVKTSNAWHVVGATIPE